VFKSALAFFLLTTACFATYTVNASVVKMEDPLRPPEFKQTKSVNNHVVKKPTWYVNEILFSGERRVAIVNNVAVTIGDSINGARVSDIKSEHVVLRYKGRVINLRLKAMSVKKQVIKQ